MHLHDTLRPSLVDQHGTADFPLDAPDVSGLLRQSSFCSVRVGRQTTSRKPSRMSHRANEKTPKKRSRSVTVRRVFPSVPRRGNDDAGIACVARKFFTLIYFDLLYLRSRRPSCLFLFRWFVRRVGESVAIRIVAVFDVREHFITTDGFTLLRVFYDQFVTETFF